MNNELKIQLQDFKKQYKNYKKYISETDWNKELDIAGSYETESSIVENMMKDLKKFTKENETSLHLKSVQEFFKFCTGVVDIHIKRIDKYLKKNDWGTKYKEDKEEIVLKINALEKEGIDETNKEHYEDLKKVVSDLESEKRKEIKFQNNLFTQKTKIRVEKLNLNIDSENTTMSPKLFYGDKKAALIMKDYLYSKDAFLRERTDLLKINWESPNPATSKEMYINMKAKDIPPYDEKKHFFEQPVSTIQFWAEEVKKIKEGININGYHLSPFLYFAANYGSIPQGSGATKKVAPALLRDNEYYFDESLKNAVEKGYEAILMFGTRRFGKTGLEALYLAQGLLSITNCSANLNGFSGKDLNEVKTYLYTIFTNLPPALRPNINVNSPKEFKLGIKESAQSHYNMAKLDILNLEGTKTGGQKPAGGTPDRILFDEIAKGDILTPYLALRPALAGGEDGKPRATVIMSGTSGDSALSKPAEKLLKNTEAYGILPMDYDLLEKIADPEYYTWTHKKFATFVPTQMSLFIPKKKTNLKEFLKSDIDELSKIDMYETDWKKGKEFFDERRKNTKSDYKAHASEISSHPMDTDDVYLSGDKNQFDAISMKRHKSYLIDNAQTGTKTRFYLDTDGKVKTSLTNDPIVETYPFSGGSISAPALVFEKVEDGAKPPFGLYVIGIDDVKHDKTSGDSVLSLTVYKRGIELSEWSDRVVCTLATRPEKKKYAYKEFYCIMKHYNAIVFIESDDEGFKDYIETRHKTDAIIHLAESVDFSRSLGFSHNKNRPIGFSTAGNNVRRLNARVLAYTQEVLDEESGMEGHTRINDTMLLEEMINNKPDSNADRLRSFGLSLIYAEYLDKENMYISKRRYRERGDDEPRKQVKMNRGLTSGFKGMKRNPW